MSCYLRGGPDLVFLRSGVSIKVKDLTTRESRDRYAYAKIRLSEESAGEVLEKAKEFEPVHISFDGHIQGRYFFTRENMTITGTRAWIKIYDSRKILNRGAVSNFWGEVRIGDIMEFIFDNRDDPHKVLTGWRTEDVNTSAEIQTEIEDVIESWLGESADTPDNRLIRGTINAGLALRDLNDRLSYDSPERNEFPGMELEDEPVGVALQTLEQIFGFSTWVDNDGVVVIGSPESSPTNFYGVSGRPTDKDYSIKDYNIKKTPTSVAGVRLEGETQFYQGNLDGRWWNGTDRGELFPIAEAWLEDPETGEKVAGTTVTNEVPIEISGLSSLEQAAKRALLNEVIKSKNGTIIFNTTASNESGKIGEMSVGDRLLVANVIEEGCRENVDGGAFIIEEVQHKVNSRQGWKTTCKVSAIPPQMNSESWYYVPAEDEKYQSSDSFNIEGK